MICFQARSPGVWSNNLVVRMQRGTRTGVRVTVLDRRDGGELVRPLEDFDNLALDTQGPNFALDVVNEQSKVVVCSALSLRHAVFTETILATPAGGTDGSPLGADEYCGGPNQPEQRAIRTLKGR